jgi:hypothetical protein
MNNTHYIIFLIRPFIGKSQTAAATGSNIDGDELYSVIIFPEKAVATQRQIVPN